MIFMRRVPAWIAVLFISASLYSQPSQLASADALFAEGDYAGAVGIYLEELEKNQHSASLNYRTGVCYLRSRSQKGKAIPYLLKAVDLTSPGIKSDNGVPADAVKLLGDAYYFDHQFEKAAEVYEKVMADATKDNEALKTEMLERIELCKYGAEARNRFTLPVDSKTGAPCGALRQVDYTSTPTPDKTAMIYTFRVPLNLAEPSDGKYFEGPMVAPPRDSVPADNKKKDTQKKPAPKPKQVVTEKDTVVYEATVGSSIDGHAVLTYRNEGGRAGIYISRLEKNKWSRPLKVRQPVNRNGWETNECLSPDGSTLYFTSDRAGGYGGTDIYKCEKLPDGQWGKAVNLGATVNTACDELAPFIHHDGKTLFFSSNRIKPASFDIFNVRLTSDGKIVNVGYPVNRDNNDIFQVTADNRKLFTPAKGGGSQAHENPAKPAAPEPAQAGDMLITFFDQNKSPMTVISGRVVEAEQSQPVKATISLIDNRTGTVVSVFYSDANGNYAFPVLSGGDYGIFFQADGYLFQTDQATITRDETYFDNRHPVTMHKLAEGAEIAVRKVVVGADGKALPTPALKRIAALMNEQPYAKGEVVAVVTTDTDRKNRRREASRRAEAIEETLKAEGIPGARIGHDVEVKSPPKPPKKKKNEEKAAKKAEPFVPTEEIVFRITKINNPK
jgi:hypothetical protein